MFKKLNWMGTSVVVLVMLLSPIAAAGKVILNGDSGVSERIVDTTGNLKSDLIVVFWFPELDPSTSSFGVTGSCKRSVAGTGEFVGTNKVKFTQVALEGFDTGTSIGVKSFRASMKDGLPSKAQVVDITQEVRQLGGAESTFLVGAKVKVAKSVDAGDYIQCFFGVVEGDASLIPMSASAAERQIALEEIAREMYYREFTIEFE